jgi:hypothetical protein
MTPAERYSVVVSTFALVAALCAGGAYAADKIRSKDIAKNAVKSSHVKNGSLKGADLKKGAITSQQVKDGSLLAADLRPGELRTAPRAYATIQEDGDVYPGSGAKGITNAMVTRVSAGVYCFHDLGFAPKSAMVSANNGFNNEHTVVSVTVNTDSSVPLSECVDDSDPIRVRTLLLPAGGAYAAPSLQDRRFNIWITD